MYALANLIDTAVSIYLTLLFASIILTWLVQFNIVNPRQPFVHTIGTFLYRITEPALAPIRRFLPNFGGIDISPIISDPDPALRAQPADLRHHPADGLPQRHAGDPRQLIAGERLESCGGSRRPRGPGQA